MEQHQSFFEANRQSWNKRTAVHKDSAFYDLAAFKKGKSSLNSIERQALGDVREKRLLHLQCHFGMDTMSWAREGAVCVGVDLSDDAIRLAREINNELNLNAEFVCCNLYDLKQHLDTPFDMVFTSYGTIGWLPNLDDWAGIVAHFLKPGGVFYIADFHPVIWMMDDRLEKIQYSYFNTGVITEEISGSYANRDAPIRSVEHGWNHSFSEIFTALLKQQLMITDFQEFPYSPYNCFSNLEQGADGMWRITGMEERIPMMYTIKAVKPFPG